MKCFDVRKRGDLYIAVSAPSVLTTNHSITPDTIIPCGEGLTVYAAIADLCNQLDMEHDAESKRKAFEAQRW